MNMDVKLRQLEFVLALAEEGTFSRAAERCHATQPSLSKSIATVEDTLGAKLFERTTRRVALTPFGTHMLPHIRAILDSRDELRAAAHAWANPAHKLLRIGFSPLVDMRMLDRAIEPYRRSHGGVEIFFKECLLDDLHKRLAEGSVDFAIMPRAERDPALKEQAFYSDELRYLPCHDDGEALPWHAVAITDMPKAPIIMTGGGCGLNGSLKALFDSQDAAFEAYPGQAVSYPVIEEWASLGIGAAILPAGKLQSGASAVRLLLRDGTPARFHFDWLWNGSANVPAHVSDFVDHVTRTVPRLVAGQAGMSAAAG